MRVNMVRTGRLFPLRLAASAFAALLFALAIVLLFLPSAPEAELTLGPARRHSPSATDFLARISKGALDAAAGSADQLLGHSGQRRRPREAR